MKKLFLLAFIIAACAELASGFFGLSMIALIAKPMIMISLGCYYTSSLRERSRFVLLAIVFSLAGDVFLLSSDYFIPGLVSFLIAHVCYIFAYRQLVSEVESDTSLRGIHRIRLAFPVVLAGSGLVVILFPVLGDLRVPVIIYAVVITTMVLTALFRYGKTTQQSFWLVFIGAVLFMVSDSILAINKFLDPLPAANFLIMSTYCAAQYCIIEGLIDHQRAHPEAQPSYE